MESVIVLRPFALHQAATIAEPSEVLAREGPTPRGGWQSAGMHQETA
jgi:hypothetical protein